VPDEHNHVHISVDRAGDDPPGVLLGLGDFFGNSWPDQPFRDSYPCCQYAMLIIARQLANVILGIGAGIEQMARTYGITENRNTADARRIETNENRIASLINHAVGIPQPPSDPFSVTLPPAPAGGPARDPSGRPRSGSRRHAQRLLHHDGVAGADPEPGTRSLPYLMAHRRGPAQAAHCRTGAVSGKSQRRAGLPACAGGRRQQDERGCAERTGGFHLLLISRRGLRGFRKRRQEMPLKAPCPQHVAQ
jgi:hypothetical protein